MDSPLLGLLLLGALAAAPLLLRRFKGAQPGGVRVLGRTALHKNAVVAVVEVGGRRLLLGAGDKGIELLTELDAESADAGDAVAVPEGRPAPVLDLSSLERTDVARQHTWSTTTGSDEALDALLGPVGSSTTQSVGPGIGLVDRLRHMTVRVSQPQRGAGRPFRASLRR
ncbi:MAG TPA: flagellar biosynthetic protein FliO [Egicoccus sp.]|nr:flagellar biosynthetic protein FliO [Egicoccus sp.]HSK21942.1 flagellar biosynthetic protein FliO [Egicoccus sp.]